jgi:glutamate/tyrosine decarboxylase-like PLP-dependent enzyme
MEKTESTTRTLNINSKEFKNAGIQTMELIADFIEALPHKKVTSGASPMEIQQYLPDQPLPVEGQDINKIIEEATTLLFDHSLFNGHPKFWGYITSSAAPIGALADLIASSVNANVGAFALSPMATEIERQTIRWLAEFIGCDPGCGGLFVSGGNMANFLGFLAARKQKINGDIRKNGLTEYSDINQAQPWGLYQKNRNGESAKKNFLVYCARGTHTWVQKAVDLFGHGTDAIRWIECNENLQMDINHLKLQIQKDRMFGHKPFLLIGNAGSVGTGAVDSLDTLSAYCKSENLWFHIDGAYGAPAASLPELTDLFKGLSEADSIALDPHKWLYSPLEAGCILVRDGFHLQDAFSFNPDYYNFKGNGSIPVINYHEYGMQNSRGFRALKVWMSFKQIGREGYVEMIRKDISLARSLFSIVAETDELEAISHNLSITTFRYIPQGIFAQDSNDYLNQLNETLLNRLQTGGEVFLSNAIIKGKYCLRVCIVNFRTTIDDLRELVEIVIREGRKLHGELKS